MTSARTRSWLRLSLYWLSLTALACGDEASTAAPAASSSAGTTAPAQPSAGTRAPAATSGVSGASGPYTAGLGGPNVSPGAGRASAADGGKVASTGAAGEHSGAAGQVAGQASPAAGIGGEGGAGTGAVAGQGATAGSAASGPRLPAVTSTAADGPFAATQALDSGPKGKSGLFRPRELGQNGLKHPLFVWGCGGSSTPMQYADQLLRVATHGFIVIAEVSTIGDNGAPLKAAIDWILAENARADSPLYGAVATDKIAMGGHSIGSANTFFVAEDPRLTTTIHIAGGSLDDVNSPFAPTTGMGGARLVHPVAYICSMSDTFNNVEKTEKDYANTRVPAWMTVMTGVEHVGAARSGLPATIAWLRWHLAGETERRSAFLDSGGEFNSGIFVSRSKNW